MYSGYIEPAGWGSLVQPVCLLMSHSLPVLLNYTQDNIMRSSYKLRYVAFLSFESMFPGSEDFTPEF